MASCPDNSVFVAVLFLHCPCKNLATRDHALFRLVNLLKVLYGVTEPVLSCENQAGSRWAAGVTYCHCVAAFADPMYCIWALTYCGHWQSDSDCCRKMVRSCFNQVSLWIGSWAVFFLSETWNSTCSDFLKSTQGIAILQRWPICWISDTFWQHYSVLWIPVNPSESTTMISTGIKCSFNALEPV
jgi:hypothetical protein